MSMTRWSLKSKRDLIVSLEVSSAKHSLVTNAESIKHCKGRSKLDIFFIDHCYYVGVAEVGASYLVDFESKAEDK